MLLEQNIHQLSFDGAYTRPCFINLSDIQDCVNKVFPKFSIVTRLVRRPLTFIIQPCLHFSQLSVQKLFFSQDWRRSLQISEMVFVTSSACVKLLPLG